MSLCNFDGRRPERINDIGHYVAPQVGSRGGPQDPQIILIFGWFGAQLAQLMIYSSKYSEVYPAASQVIIESDAIRGELGSRAATINRQRPIVTKLEQLDLFSEMPPRILIHVLSGGGTAQLLWLALALEARVAPQTRPPTCLVIDSAPGSFHHSDMQRVLTYSLTGFKKLVGLAITSIIYTGLQMRSTMTGHPMIHDFVRDGLAKPKVLPWMDSSAPRLYLYSDADRIACASDVRAHIEAAKKSGIINIQEEYFLGSEHVQHSKAYPEKYWNAIRSTWNNTVRSKL